MSTTKNVNAKKETSNLTKINFEKFAKDVANVSEKVKSSQRSILYNYPEKWNALQINGAEGKNFRSDKRRKLFSFAGLIQLHYKMKNAEKLIEEIKNFNKFYKEFFRVNDYSISSITNTKGEINAEYVKMLNIVKEVSFSTEKVKAPKKAIVKKEDAKKENAKKEVVALEVKEEIK